MIPNKIKQIVPKFYAYKPSWNEAIPLLEIFGFTMISQFFINLPQLSFRAHIS